MDIVIVWALIILLGVSIYVILDGFDLGVGILFPFAKDESERDLMMESIAPVWGANETWMVLGGAALFGAFPIAYSVILSALYQPILLMLFALIFRGVSFEYRARATKEKQFYWNWAFFGGSFISAFAQGVIAGAFVSGFPMEGDQYIGGVTHWLTPFNMLAGIGLAVFYALLGGTWLIIKMKAELQDKIRMLTHRILFLFLAIAFLLFVWTLLMHRVIFPSWKIYSLIAIGIGMIVPALFLIRAIKNRNTHYSPFMITLVATLFGALGLVFAIWPYVIPFEYTIWQAAGPHSSLKFTLIGTLIFLPLITAYTGFSYYVFRGKVSHKKDGIKENNQEGDDD